MKIEPIDIKIQTNDGFTDVALLVDRRDFLHEVVRLRTKYGFEPVHSPDSSKRARLELDVKKRSDDNFSKKWKADIEKIRRMFGLPMHFLKVIEEAVAFGMVRSYSRAYLDEQVLYPAETEYGIPEIKYSIVISPSTKKKDVLEAFEQFEEEVDINFRSPQKDKKSYKFGYWYNPTLQAPIDVKSTIKKIREWYLLRQSGKSPLTIALKDLKISKKEYKIFRDRYEKHSDTDNQEYKNAKIKTMEIRSYVTNVKRQLARYRELLTKG